jgi:hypothetical protein
MCADVGGVGARRLATGFRLAPDFVGFVARRALGHGDARGVGVVTRPDEAVLARAPVETRSAGNL